ncbi:WSC domain-containing protein [Drepanopeziza brunnea f. sp. 'multigermtubi' MB_m1]|uniref:WSC domain-containing protein n=1 Tax=Marssonina brunnea f. sp. multigermtubi (strain MB_m1) TaxID=1072389 RepID=K1WHQ5_MARBU|nr:WSC domain-containing protein [Drepanopeziza brunnea f. sp. 'multigermtubi' MB_m1]EKD12406.1 WSC domain-containing protein [Drepanopeziza brunnea f. sp. 'multigermtubi' MB_m1]
MTASHCVSPALDGESRSELPRSLKCAATTFYRTSASSETSYSGSPRTLLYTGPRNQNQTVQACVAFCKGNDYQYAGLEYGKECFCGASVNNIQATESDCDFSCGGDSTEVCGGLKHISIYQDPTFPVADFTTISDYQKLGCYSEGSMGRSLSWRQSQVNASTMTVESCLTACKTGGYSFAGLEFAQECYCGVVLGNGTLPVDDSKCNKPCRGNPSETCGGSSVLDLYVAKDLESTEPSPFYKAYNFYLLITIFNFYVEVSDYLFCSAYCNTPFITSSPTPTCEYRVGKWCSNPLPAFYDKSSCWAAFSSCTVQAASCFLKAGFPASMNCFQFSSWCTSVGSYCSNYCPGISCSKDGCRSKYPPSGPARPSSIVSTSVYTCPAPTAKPSTTSATPTLTSYIPIPTNSNICVQPNNPRKGYSSDSPVGGIGLPCLTCNNMLSGFMAGFPFKLYTSARSEDCPSYPRYGNNGPSKGCQDACDSQYNSCVDTYAQGCRNNKRGDNFDTANTKCKNQWYDCHSANANVNPNNRCGSWNSGWF